MVYVNVLNSFYPLYSLGHKMDDNEFKERVRTDLNEIKENSGFTQDGDAFSVWFGSKILNLDEKKVTEQYFMGSKDEKIDLGVIDDDLNINIICQCKYQDNFNKDLIDEVTIAFERIKTAKDSGNEKRKKFAEELSVSSKPTELIAVCYGKTTPEVYDYAIQKKVEIYDFERLKAEYINSLSGDLPKPKSIILKPKDNTMIKYEENKINCYIFLLSVNQIHQIVKEYMNGLFTENLRYKLINKKSDAISQSIKNTIRENPQKLVIFNNGITLTCKNMVPIDEGYNFISPSIVNGCQTSYATYEILEQFRKANRKVEDVHAYTLVKVIKTTDELLKRDVTSSTNTQNRITNKNLKSDNRLLKELKIGFNEYEYDGKDIPIFFNMKEGDWSSIEQKKEQGKYRISGVSGRGSYRTIDNEFAGQLRLALMGLPHYCKNRKYLIFDDDKYFNAIFNFENPKLEEVDVLEADAKLRNGRKPWVEDLVFAYSIYKISQAVQMMYKNKLSIYGEADKDTEDYKNIKKKEFMEFWNFYLVRLIHFIIERKVNGNDQKRQELREKLLGNDLNLFFGTSMKIAENFNLDSNKNKYIILDVEKISKNLPLVNKWLISLEQAVYDVIDEAMKKPDWKNFNYYFDKRDETINDFNKKLIGILGGAYEKLAFPEN